MGIMIYPATLATKFTFGKHKGKSVKQVIAEEPGYIDWCDDNIPGFDLTQDAWDEHSATDDQDGLYGTSDFERDESDPWRDNYDEPSRDHR